MSEVLDDLLCVLGFTGARFSRAQNRLILAFLEHGPVGGICDGEDMRRPGVALLALEGINQLFCVDGQLLSIESVSPAETVSPDELKKLFSIVESVAAGQTEILNLLTEQANRMTNMEGAISLCNERILKASTDMMAMKAAEAAAAQSTIMRKPVNPSDPPQAISLVPYMELQEQIDAFIESAEGKALDVSINGKSFAMDAHLVRAAQHVKKPRDFAAVIFQMVLDVSHLKDYSIGYLDTGRVAGISKRQNGGPKTLFSEDFNRFLGNLCMLCGGCVVHETTLRVWWSEVRYGLNSKGDNIFAGSSLTSPDLHYMRPGSVHLPVFSDPKVFAAPPARKRRFVVNESAASVEELG
uniref:TLDc domain-containing protein n=1 Tax=Panagrellus redivivus TaxID=6233 RepID=A0A7E4WD80_PANRE